MARVVTPPASTCSRRLCPLIALVVFLAGMVSSCQVGDSGPSQPTATVSMAPATPETVGSPPPPPIPPTASLVPTPDTFAALSPTTAPPEQVAEVYAYETELPPSSNNRLKNIRLVIKKLNGTALPAGDEFSFNRTVGARTVKAGFRKATIVVKGQKKEGIGGGVCQVSTTLYNAAQLAGMTITEHHAHSRDIGYVEEGQDAAVNYGSLDLKFRNDTEKSFVIECTLTKTTVQVRLCEQRKADLTPEPTATPAPS